MVSAITKTRLPSRNTLFLFPFILMASSQMRMETALVRKPNNVFTKAKRSEVMSRIRGRGNKETEIALVRLLRRNKITGWRRHVLLKFRVSNSEFRVRPDFVLSKLRVAILVDGCFWHCCPKHSNMPANNHAFWRRKLDSNKARDLLVNRTLRRQGWRILGIWGHNF